MIHSQATKYVNTIPPVSLQGTADPTAVDTLGFDRVSYAFFLGTVGAALTKLVIQECETENGIYTDIDATDFGDTGNPVLPTAADDGKIWFVDIAINGARKRFQKPAVITGAGACLVSGVAMLSRAEEAPYSAATRGVAQQVIAL